MSRQAAWSAQDEVFMSQALAEARRARALDTCSRALTCRVRSSMHAGQTCA